MNKRQKAIVSKLVTVVVVTSLAVVVMINFRTWVNRSEAMRAMERLGKEILKYRQSHGIVPPESYITDLKKNLEGQLRLGKLHYRALWIDSESGPDEILAYTTEIYHSLLFGKEFLVLRLNGDVEWMDKEQFEKLLAQQQSPTEVEMTKKLL